MRLGYKMLPYGPAILGSYRFLGEKSDITHR